LTTAKAKPKNLQQRMLLIMKDVDPMMKEHRNKHQNYDYVSHDQVAEYMRTVLVAHGVCHLLSARSYEVHDDGAVTVGMDLTLINADDPADTMTSTVWHTQPRMGGKEAGAALSYCKKFAFGLCFLLNGTGEEIDSQKATSKKNPPTKKSSTTKPKNPDAPISEKQSKFLWVKAKAAKIPEREIVLILHLNGCHGPKDLNMGQFNSILKWIDNGGGLDCTTKVKETATNFLLNYAATKGPPGLDADIEEQFGDVETWTVSKFEKAYKYAKAEVNEFVFAGEDE